MRSGSAAGRSRRCARPNRALEDPLHARHRSEEHVALPTATIGQTTCQELREEDDAAERDRLLQRVAAAYPQDRHRGRCHRVRERAVHRLEPHGTALVLRLS
jgi:hypothetical protein